MMLRLSAFTLIVTLLMSCSIPGKETRSISRLERFNRFMYNFNYGMLDPYLVRPIAVLWNNHIPQPIRKGIGSFSSNLEEPAIMVNYFLQGNPYQGMIHFTRFFLNVLFGMGGFIDIAGLANQKLQREIPHRFGSTLGYYGINYGPYIHLPFYGSFTFRDDIGNMVDMLYPILSWINLPLHIIKWIFEGIETRAQLLDSDSLLFNSYHPYEILREVYFQRHNFIVNNNQPKLEDNPNVKIIENELLEIDSE